MKNPKHRIHPAIEALFANALTAADHPPPRPSGRIEYQGGGTMEIRTREPGLWDDIPKNLRHELKKHRVVFHVDRDTRCIVGWHFAPCNTGRFN